MAAAHGVVDVVVTPVANTATGAPDAGVKVEQMPGGETQVPRMRAKECRGYNEEHPVGDGEETAGGSRPGVAAAEGPSMCVP